jgi:capping protein beta
MKLAEKGVGSWDSIHVLQISQFEGKSAHYQLTSTILLDLDASSQQVGDLDLCGSMTRQAEQEFPLENFKSHISNMGRFVEDMESKMRHSIQDVYFGKTKDIIGELRSLTDLEEAKKQAAIQSELAAKLANRRKQ